MAEITKEKYEDLLNEKEKLSLHLEVIEEKLNEYENSNEDSEKKPITKEMQKELNDFKENCLIISEKNQKVILPFSYKDITDAYQSNDKYVSLQDVIKNNYTVNLSEYKFPAISRFKQAYKLMRNKENADVLSSISFALELATNSYLNPAVITACNNKAELDIYLDCLYNNELDDFDIFDVKYEYAPTLV